MYIVERIRKVDPFFGSLGLTIGNFDGFHLGHREILRLLSHECRRRGLYSAVITFKEHPLKLIRGEAPKYLGPRAEKIRWFQKLGVDILFFIEFDLSIAGTKPLGFLEDLQKALDPRLYCLGRSFRFGKDNGGDIELIRKQKTELRYEIVCVDDVKIDGEAVSSTRIRKAVSEGNIQMANRLLGRQYTVWLERDDTQAGTLLSFLPDAALPFKGSYEGEMLDMKTKENAETVVSISGRLFRPNTITESTGALRRFSFQRKLSFV